MTGAGDCPWISRLFSMCLNIYNICNECRWINNDHSYSIIQVLQRRVDLMAAEGIIFQTDTEIGKNLSCDKLLDEHDAVLLSTGATWPRDLPIPGRVLSHIVY